MARSVLFHNRRIIHPGAEAYVDLTGMVQPGADVDRISAVVGEAPYGEPGVVHIFADAEAARQLFGSGSDLADGIRLLFSPSNDERVEGGAVVVYAYKANHSTQAEYWLTREPVTGPFVKDVTLANMVVGTNPAYVAFTAPIYPAVGSFAPDTFKNLIVEVFSGRGVGQQAQIASSGDDGIGNHVLYLRDDLNWKTIPNASKIEVRIPMNKISAAEWGTLGLSNKIEYGIGSQDKTYQLQATYNERQESPPATFGGLDEPTLWIQFDPSGGGSQLLYSDVNNWHVPQAVNAAGTTTGASTQTLLDQTAAAMPVDTAGATGDVKDRWVLITGTTKTNDPQHQALLGKMFKVFDNTANAVQLYEPGLGVNLTDKVGLQWKGMQVSDSYIKVLGKNGASETLQVYMRDGLNLAPSVDLLLGTVDLKALSSIAAVVETLNEIPGVTARLGDGVDGTLSTDRFDFGDDSEHQNYQVTGVVASLAAIGATQAQVDSTGNYVGIGVFPDPDSAYAYPIIIDRGTAEEEVLLVDDVTLAPDMLNFTTLTTKAHDVGSVIERIVNGLPAGVDSYWTLATPVGTDTRIYRLGSALIRGPGDVDATGRLDPGDFVRDDNEDLITSAFEAFGRFTIERATDPASSTYEAQVGAAQADDMRGQFKALYNGTEGTSVVSKPDTADPNYPISWEHGLDELLKVDDIRNIVPLASSDMTGWTAGDIDTLVAMFQEHLKEGDEARAERQGYMGLILPLRASTIAGVTYPRGLLEWIRFLNEERMSMTGQTTRVFASSGSEEVLPPWGLACQCAGIQMGTEVGEALTLKFVKTSELAQPFNDWDPRDRLDQRDALLGGLLYGEPSRGRWRIVRGQTTFIANDNLARTDINVWEIRNVVIRDMRQQLEDRFGGVGIGTSGEGVRFVAPASVAGIREYIANILEEYRADGIILDSQDENGQPVHAWTGLSVKISGDIARIKVQVFPKTSLNFILIDFGFQIPVISS